MLSNKFLKIINWSTQNNIPAIEGEFINNNTSQVLVNTKGKKSDDDFKKQFNLS